MKQMDMRSKETGELSVVSAKRVFNALKVVRDRNAQLKTLLLIYNPLYGRVEARPPPARRGLPSSSPYCYALKS